MAADRIALAQSKRLGIGRDRLLILMYSMVIGRLTYASN